MKKFTYTLNVIMGVFFGFISVYFIFEGLIVFNVANPYQSIGKVGVACVYIFACLLGMMLFVAMADKMGAFLKRVANSLEGMFSNVPTGDLLISVVGLIIGLVIATLMTALYSVIPWAWVRLPLSFITYIILGYLGTAVATNRRNDFNGVFKGLYKNDKKKEKYPNAKILDTSAVIDGRILDIMRSDFLEGTIIISDLILNELRHIADNGDVHKRNRGRRGLDLLKIMQQEFDKRVVVVNVGGKYKDIEDVDEKLVMLTKDLKGKIITNDYNLNMMATVQKVPVLNVNELAGCLKPNIMSGEKLEVEVVKPGKERGQGIAYLEDGTMIVVEDGYDFVGQVIQVEITSIIQTASGRMIFAVSSM